MRILLRRGASFAWQALHIARAEGISLAIIAFISVSPTLFDSSQVTGNVTFCSVRTPTSPYIDIESYPLGVVVAIESSECDDPLPV
jgi:hypothetical protein